MILRQLGPKSKFCEELDLAVIAKAVPGALIDAVIERTGTREERERKLPARVAVLLCIAMNLYSTCRMSQVMRKLSHGLRLIFDDGEYPLPGDAAICRARYRLGARPLVELFRRVCRPMATAQTPGAFLFGLRVMAVDGTKEDVADTPENTAAFGRPSTSRSRQGAFPQALVVYLVECGTHAIVDTGIWAGRMNERAGGMRLLRSVGKGMLLTWDRGYHSYAMLRQTIARGAHVLGRMSAGTKPGRIRQLPDGTHLIELSPAKQKRSKRKGRPHGGTRRKKCQPIRVRLIEYTITDPRVSGYGQRHRLITTLVNWRRFPALELVVAYHQRWEIELTIDEIDTHQRLPKRPLRSLKPKGAVQELYGMLIAHYAVRSIMHDTAVQEGIDPDQLSFVHALEVIRDAVADFQMVTQEQLPQLYARLLRDVAQGRLPERRPRSNPRVVKRKMSNFLLKRPESWPGYQKLPEFKSMVVVM